MKMKALALSVLLIVAAFISGAILLKMYLDSNNPSSTSGPLVRINDHSFNETNNVGNTPKFGKIIGVITNSSSIIKQIASTEKNKDIIVSLPIQILSTTPSTTPLTSSSTTSSTALSTTSSTTSSTTPSTTSSISSSTASSTTTLIISAMLRNPNKPVISPPRKLNKQICRKFCRMYSSTKQSVRTCSTYRGISRQKNCMTCRSRELCRRRIYL